MVSALRDQRVLLTGASFGIGEALARELARHRARLALTARTADRLQELAQELGKLGAEVAVVPGDVTSEADRQRIVAETVRLLGGLDILVNNAGVGASGYFHEASPERLRRIMEVNFFGPAELTRLALPHLFRGNKPMIVNISSVIGRRGVPGYSEYCASKFALCGFSESLRAELVRFGVHVLLVNPGLIETPFRDHLVEDRLRSREQRRRAMSPEQCARVIVRAMRRRVNEVVITFDGKLLVWLNRLFPRLVDWLLAKYAQRYQE
ncbi:MAG: SDR family oxidoreductase [Gemmatales bacterium]|nr:SDR family oxidoreductase [Gemmatales bacterium]